MGRSRFRAAIAIMLVLAAWVGATRDVMAADETTFVARANPGPIRTDGETVVWDEWSRTGADRDIYAASLSDRQPYAVTPSSGDRNDVVPDVSGNMVVWQESICPPGGQTCLPPDIRARNLATGESFTVAGTPAGETAPAISGRWAIWLEESRVKARDLSTMAEPLTLAEPAGGAYALPLLDAGRIVWLKLTGEVGRGVYTWQMLSRRIDAPDATVVAEGVGPVSLRLSGDVVVYQSSASPDRTFHAVDVVTGQSWAVAAGATASLRALDHQFLFWSESTSPENLEFVLRGYHLPTGFSFEVDRTDSANLITNADAGGGVIAWVRYGEIHAARIAQFLPTARRGDPGATDPNWTYFPETGHYLAHGFRAFWEQSGGLPVFGYPLTEEFTEHDVTVQYLERQRFEYHPEHQGTPYEVELGRLGYEDAARRGLLTEPAFAPGPIPGFDPGPDCHFFSTTGFPVCGDFYRFWRSHGLEFGDPDIAFRESLALFGYPVSKPYVDPATGLTVQYFERARFEWHPNNPEPYRVLLGRLGADLLTQRGW